MNEKENKSYLECIKEIMNEIWKAQRIITKCRLSLDKIINELSGDEEIIMNAEIINRSESDSESCPYSKIRDLYNNICVSLPKIRNIDGCRKKSVHSRWESCGKRIEDFEELFKIAEASSFLKGDNSRKWSANFDWLMNPHNFAKTLEHLYDDKKSSSEHESSFSIDEWDEYTLFGGKQP